MLAYVQSVLDLGAEQIAEVERLHDEAVATGIVTGRMQALIKNVVENQRSPLDYTAQAISDRYKLGTNPYWPAAKESGDFTHMIERQLPGLLAAQPDVAAALERHQPYQPGHEWMPCLFALTRENKHHRLTPQKRGSDIATIGGVGRSQVKGVMGISLPEIKTAMGMRVTRWDFEQPPVGVLDALHRIQDGVHGSVLDVCNASGL
jgi:hypothetical protein